jgi:hypothetical protein
LPKQKRYKNFENLLYGYEIVEDEDEIFEGKGKAEEEMLGRYNGKLCHEVIS